MASLYSNHNLGNTGNWQERHDRVVTRSLTGLNSNQSLVSSLVLQLNAWANYAAAHHDQHDSLIGHDSFLRRYWVEIGLGVRGLLNGVTGPLDCGTLDAFILDTMKENGVDLDEYGL